MMDRDKAESLYIKLRVENIKHTHNNISKPIEITEKEKILCIKQKILIPKKESLIYRFVKGSFPLGIIFAFTLGAIIVGIIILLALNIEHDIYFFVIKFIILLIISVFGVSLYNRSLYIFSDIYFAYLIRFIAIITIMGSIGIFIHDVRQILNIINYKEFTV